MLSYIATLADTQSVSAIRVGPNDSKSRLAIPKKLRVQAWLKDNLPPLGVCYVCKESVSAFDYECGHVQSVAHGGSTTIDNLRAICKDCNRGMSSMNMDDYIKTYYPDKHRSLCYYLCCCYCGYN